MMRVTMGVSPDEPVSERHVSLIARGLVVDWSRWPSTLKLQLIFFLNGI
jgi:hypothetical protein